MGIEIEILVALETAVVKKIEKEGVSPESARVDSDVFVDRVSTPINNRNRTQVVCMGSCFEV